MARAHFAPRKMGLVTVGSEVYERAMAMMKEWPRKKKSA